jgi:putative peptide zinc metalloprotease protein
LAGPVPPREGAPAPSRAAAGRARGQSVGPLQLAEGIELVGRFEDSGYKVAPWLVRRADGQTLQLSELLYQTAEAIGDGGSAEQVAAAVSAASGRDVTADNVETLVRDKLRPLGIVVAEDGSSPTLEKRDPLLALTYRAGLVPDRLVRRAARPFTPLFAPVVMALTTAALLAVDVYVFGVVGIGEGVREAIYEPAVLLLVLGVVVASAAFHEFGHAAACLAGGATPGKMGAGIYLVYPVFYTDVTDAYRLSRWKRIAVDLGGVYFNGLVVLLTFAVYLATGFEPLLLVILFQHLEMFHQFLPFVRLDGYYVVSDLTGVPDLFPRIKPILSRLLPWRETPPEVDELKPWARRVVTGWVLLVIPVLAANLLFLAVYTPRIMATTFDSMLVQVDTVREAAAGGDVLAVVAGVAQALVLLLPAIGVPLIFYRLLRRVTSSVHSRIRAMDVALPRPRAGVAGAVGLAAIAAGVLFVVWPNGDYRPLQRGERLNTVEFASSVRTLSSGRPGLSVEREAELGDVGFEYERRRAEGPDASASPPSPAEAASPTATPTPSGEPTTSEEPTASEAPTPSGEPTPTSEPAPSASSSAVPTSDPTASPTATAPPQPTATALATPTS